MRVVAIALLLLSTDASADPLLFYNGRLFIQARVNGVPTEALLDSAAEASLVDPAFAATVKLPEGTAQDIRGPGGRARARIVEGVTIDSLGQRLHPDAVVVTDLSEISRRLIKRPTNVVIGRELFDAARLRIDITHGRIESVDRKPEPQGKRLELKDQHGVEAISSTVNGAAVQAEFDLGNGSDVLVSRALVNKLKLKVIGRKAGGGIGGPLTREVVRLDMLDIGGRRFRNIVAAIDDQSNAGNLNVGTSILKHFVITADFSQHAVWLQPRGR